MLTGSQGAGNFVRKSVFGVTDSFAKFTGSIGKGLSAASLDSEWQAKRRAQMRRNKPKHAINGLGIGAQSFVTGVASGMEGVLRQPIEGLESEGAAGLVKGMGKGFVGCVLGALPG
jgi:vacuolar protein sorting-associated protein 13A/C